MLPIAKTIKYRILLDECDPNSQDSGYGAGPADKDEMSMKCPGFQFAEPLGMAPRLRSPVSSTSPLVTSSGFENMDDGFTDSIDMEALDENVQFPSGLSSLLSGLIMSSEKPMSCRTTTPETRSKLSCRRSLSLQNENIIHPASKVRSCLFRSPNGTSSTAKLSLNDTSRILPSTVSLATSLKYSELSSDTSPVSIKRSKTNSLQEISKPSSFKKPAFQRSLSETETHARIESAINRSTTGVDLTGDFSKQCILPLAEAQQEDLMSISSETLAALMYGEFRNQVNSFKIVDCRYPYEFEAGHIKGALNLYTKDMIEQQLLDPLISAAEIKADTVKRDVVVFHCELSWERGPILSRFLRRTDRQRNQEYYPALHYPEMYILQGGYQQFYHLQKELCTPQGYKPMRHPDHEVEMRQFRCKTKTWEGEKSRFTVQAKRKRLGL